MKFSVIKDIKGVVITFIELSWQHVLPHFRECWWDHILVDLLLSNTPAIYIGNLDILIDTQKSIHKYTNIYKSFLILIYI
jgi:hypothetical protein